MHAIFSQLSGLIGLTVFLTRAWRLAPVDSAVLTGIGAALAVYATLIAGDIIVRRILAYSNAASDPKAGRGRPSRGNAPNSVSTPRSEKMAMAEAGAA
ncbi:MAG TPA: hypothetical protein VFG50_04225 [Rhodothermales bacterium]|nr:hypothetical protein [Rhodothermales bacterium]